MRLKNNHYGYSLTEILMALSVLGLVSAIAVSRIFVSFSDKSLESGKLSTLSDLEHIKGIAESTLGSLPKTYGLAKVFERFSGLTKYTPGTSSIGLCPTGGEMSYRFPSGPVITNVGESWTDDGGQTDKVCVALKGEKSQTPGKDIFWVTVHREGPIELASMEATKGVFVHSWFSATWYQDGFLTGYRIWDGNYDLMQILATLFPQISSTAFENYRMYVTDESGNVKATDNFDFANGLYINGKPFVMPTLTEEEKNDIYTSYYVNDWYDLPDTLSRDEVLASHFARQAIDQYAFEFLTPVMKEIWQITEQELADSHDTYAEWGSTWILNPEDYDNISNEQQLDMIRNAYSQMSIYYYDKTENKYYKPDTLMFYSPVKLSLNGVSAKLNSDDFFPFDVDGKSGKMAPFVTTGGVNKNEAWLATDRNGDGFWVKGVQDGRDVFGDHLGRYKSGYDDLAALYKQALKKDANGKRYIALKKLSFLEKQQANVARLASKPKQFDPSIDLKLLTRDRKVFFASDFVDKIYVDYQDVNELDAKKQNWIRQRAQVHYLGGQTVTSADQWFQAGFIFTPLNDAEVKKLKSKAAQVKSKK